MYRMYIQLFSTSFGRNMNCAELSDILSHVSYADMHAITMCRAFVSKLATC